NTQRPLDRGVGCLVLGKSRIRDLLYETRSEYRGWNAEDHIVIAHGSGEILRRHRTARRIGTTADGEQRVHSPIGTAFRVSNEARPVMRPVYGEDGGNGHGTMVGGGKPSLGNIPCPGPAGSRLHMATFTAVQVHGGPEAVLYVLRGRELHCSKVEQVELSL